MATTTPENTATVMQGPNQEPLQLHTNTNTVVGYGGGFQHPTQPFQNQGGVGYQGGNPHQISAVSVAIQGTPQTMNTTPVVIQGASPQPSGNTNEQVFPIRTLKVLGGVQIGLGVLLCVLSLVGTILDSVHMTQEKDLCVDSRMYMYDGYNNYHTLYYNPCYNLIDQYRILFAFDVTCLVLSGWFILTGFLPLCMSRKRQNSWKCLKISFMVCCILGASIFLPPVFSLGVAGSIIREIYSHTRNTTVLSALIAVLSFVELVLAIISASYCCCCTKWNTDAPAQQAFVYVGGANPQLIMIPQSQIPGTNMQPVVMTNRQQQYTVNQQQTQNASGENLPQTCTNNETINPPPYKELT